MAVACSIWLSTESVVFFSRISMDKQNWTHSDADGSSLSGSICPLRVSIFSRASQWTYRTGHHPMMMAIARHHLPFR
jgi:hypothetical protein